MCPGDYQIKFTDANLCVDSVIIPLIERDSFVVADWPIPVSCYGVCDGQITVQLINQDNPPFTYIWDNGASDSIASNLCSDSISLELIDARGCRAHRGAAHEDVSSTSGLIKFTCPPPVF